MRGSTFGFRKTKLFRALIVVGVLVFLISWNPQALFSPFRIALGTVAIPFERFFAFTGFRLISLGEFLSSIGDLKQENVRLLEENIQLKAEYARLADMRRENEYLRHELGLLPRERFVLEAADVIGQDSLSAGNWLLVNKGKSHGLEAGMPVIVSESILIGRVSEVLPFSAKITLLTSPESLVNAMDVQTQAKGIIKGQYGLGLLLDMVLQTDTVKAGDDIVTSGLGGDMPRGLLVGKVQETRLSDDHLFQQATLVSPVKSNRLQSVFIIKNEKGF